MLELKHVSKIFDDRIIIDDLSICFPDYGMIGIQGLSGCGKSTLLYMIGMLDDCFSGDIEYNGEKVTDRQMFIRQHISFMMQNKDVISSLTVKENIILPSCIAQSVYTSSQFQKIVTQLGIQETLSRYPSQLSGGQLKRVSIAKALLKQADILLCDEPTGALHQKQAEEVMKLLKQVSQTRLVIIVSHDPLLLKKYCDYLYTLENGKLKGKQAKLQTLESVSKKQRYHTLWFYPWRQFLYQRNKLMFLFLFQWIVIAAFFLIVTAIFGVFDAVQQSEVQAVQTHMMTIERKDGSPFDTLITDERIADVDYQYHWEQCQLFDNQKEIHGQLLVLPQDCSHLVLSQGHLPIHSNEVIVSEAFARQYPRLHDLQIIYQQKVFSIKVVGVLAKDFFGGQDVYLSPLIKSEFSDLVNAYELVVESQKDRTEALYDSLSHSYFVYSEVKERVESYQSLLDLSQMVAGVFIGISLLISLLLMGLVESIIYFERKHDTAYLLSLGLTPRRLRYLALTEAFLMGGIMVLGGHFLSMLLYEYVNHVLQIDRIFSFSLSLKPFFFSSYDLYIVIFVIYMLMSVLSVLQPLRHMMKVDMIDVLREE